MAVSQVRRRRLMPPYKVCQSLPPQNITMISTRPRLLFPCAAARGPLKSSGPTSSAFNAAAIRYIVPQTSANISNCQMYDR